MAVSREPLTMVGINLLRVATEPNKMLDVQLKVVLRNGRIAHNKILRLVRDRVYSESTENKEAYILLESGLRSYAQKFKSCRIDQSLLSSLFELIVKRKNHAAVAPILETLGMTHAQLLDVPPNCQKNICAIVEGINGLAFEKFFMQQLHIVSVLRKSLCYRDEMKLRGFTFVPGANSTFMIPPKTHETVPFSLFLFECKLMRDLVKITTFANDLEFQQRIRTIVYAMRNPQQVQWKSFYEDLFYATRYRECFNVSIPVVLPLLERIMKYEKVFNMSCSHAWLYMREALKGVAIQFSGSKENIPKQAEGLVSEHLGGIFDGSGITENLCEVFEHALDLYRKDLGNIAHVYEESYKKIQNFMDQSQFSPEQRKPWLQFLPALTSQNSLCLYPKTLPSPKEFLNLDPHEGKYELITDTIANEGVGEKHPGLQWLDCLPRGPYRAKVQPVQKKLEKSCLPPLEHTNQDKLPQSLEALNISPKQAEEKTIQAILPSQSVPFTESVAAVQEKDLAHKVKVDVIADSTKADAAENFVKSTQKQQQEKLPFAIGEGAGPWLFAARVRAWEDESCDPITYDLRYTQKQLSHAAKAQIRRYHTLPRAILTVAMHYGKRYCLNDEGGYLLRSCITLPTEVQGCGENSYYDKGVITIAIDASLKHIFHYYFEQKSRSTILSDIQRMGYIPASEEVHLTADPTARHKMLDDDGSRIVDIQEDGTVVVFDKRHNMLWTLDKF